MINILHAKDTQGIISVFTGGGGYRRCGGLTKLLEIWTNFRWVSRTFRAYTKKTPQSVQHFDCLSFKLKINEKLHVIGVIP